jgi:hypothetical protein
MTCCVGAMAAGRILGWASRTTDDLAFSDSAVGHLWRARRSSAQCPLSAQGEAEASETVSFLTERLTHAE